MRTPTSPALRSRLAGATLAELLVALLILAVGILGIWSLYVDNLQNGRSGLTRSVAAELASEMAHRIRTAPSGHAAFARSITQACVQESTEVAERAAANAVACWQDEVAAALPNGTGIVTRDTATQPATYVVTVSWSETGSGTASYVVRVQA